MTRQSPPIVPERGVPLTAETVVVPVDLVRSLLGEASFDGRDFGDERTKTGGKIARYWWRKPLRDFLSASPAREPEDGAVLDAHAVAVGRLTWAANTHPDPDKKALLTQWADECAAALTTKEAPAATGAGEDAFLSWLEREVDEASSDIGAAHQEGGTATEREKARPGILLDVRAEYLTLRAQPQARSLELDGAIRRLEAANRRHRCENGPSSAGDDMSLILSTIKRLTKGVGQ